MDIKIPSDIIRKAIDIISQKIPLTYEIQDIKQFQDRGRPYLFFICKAISFQLRIYNIKWAYFGKNTPLKIQYINIVKLSQQSFQLLSSSDHNSMNNALQAVQNYKQTIKNRQFPYDNQANNQMVSSKRFLDYSSFRQNLLQQFFQNSLTLKFCRVIKKQDDQRYYFMCKLPPKYRQYFMYICKQNQNYNLQITVKQKSVQQSDQWLWSPPSLTFEYVKQSILAFKGCCQPMSLTDFYLNQFQNIKEVYLQEVGQIQSTWKHRVNRLLQVSVFVFPHVCLFQIMIPIGGNIVRQTERINHVSNIDYSDRVQKLVQEILESAQIRRSLSVITAIEFQRYTRNIIYFEQ